MEDLPYISQIFAEAAAHEFGDGWIQGQLDGSDLWHGPYQRTVPTDKTLQIKQQGGGKFRVFVVEDSWVDEDEDVSLKELLEARVESLKAEKGSQLQQYCMFDDSLIDYLAAHLPTNCAIGQERISEGKYRIGFSKGHWRDLQVVDFSYRITAGKEALREAISLVRRGLGTQVAAANAGVEQQKLPWGLQLRKNGYGQACVKRFFEELAKLRPEERRFDPNEEMCEYCEWPLKHKRCWHDGKHYCPYIVTFSCPTCKKRWETPRGLWSREERRWVMQYCQRHSWVPGEAVEYKLQNQENLQDMMSQREEKDSLREQQEARRAAAPRRAEGPPPAGAGAGPRGAEAAARAWKPKAGGPRPAAAARDGGPAPDGTGICREEVHPLRHLSWSQDDISGIFTHGGTIEALADELRRVSDPYTVLNEPLSVVRHEGRLVCLDNRRLWCMKRAYMHECSNAGRYSFKTCPKYKCACRKEILVKVFETPEDYGSVFYVKYTNTDQGSSVVVRWDSGGRGTTPYTGGGGHGATTGGAPPSGARPLRSDGPDSYARPEAQQGPRAPGAGAPPRAGASGCSVGPEANEEVPGGFREPSPLPTPDPSRSGAVVEQLKPGREHRERPDHPAHLCEGCQRWGDCAGYFLSLNVVALAVAFMKAQDKLHGAGAVEAGEGDIIFDGGIVLTTHVMDSARNRTARSGGG